MITIYNLKSGVTERQMKNIVKAINDAHTFNENLYVVEIFNNIGNLIIRANYGGAELHKQFIRFFELESADEKDFAFEVNWEVIQEIKINELNGAVEIKYSL